MKNKVNKKIVICIVCITLLLTYYSSMILAETSIEGSNVQTSLKLVWQETFAKRAHSEFSRPYFNLYEVLSEVNVNKTVYAYDYNEMFNRVSKKVNDKLIAVYKYEENNLVYEEREGNVFVYKYDIYNNIVGFELNDENYNYIFKNRNVVTIIDKYDNEVVRYEYDENGIILSILGLNQNNQWIDMQEDKEFLGNINKIRYASKYFDEETSYYYDGIFYFDINKKQYVSIRACDNKIPTLSQILEELNIIETKSLTLNQVSDIVDDWVDELFNDPDFPEGVAYSSSWYNALEDVDVVARLIYAENTSNLGDQAGIMWVLYNRKNSSGFPNTYIGVATENGEFSSIMYSCDNAQYPNGSAYGFINAVYISCLLHTTNTSSYIESLVCRPSGITTHTSFRGVDPTYEDNRYRDYLGNLQFNFSTGTPANWQNIYSAYIIYSNGTTEEMTSLSDIAAITNKSSYNLFFLE